MSTRDITEEPVSTLGIGVGAASAALAPDGIAWDVAIGALPFLIAPSQQFPYMRETAQWRRQQLDTSREPGEQSLTGDWLRSQSSFHLGSGSRFYDPELAGEDAANQFWASVGVDVWTPGVVSLLPQAINRLSGSAVQLVGFVSGAGWVVLDAGTLKYVDATTWTVSNGPTSVVAATVTGSRVYYATATQILYDDIPTWGSPVTVGSLSNVSRLAWVKQRLMALCSNGTLFDVAVSLVTPLYTHPLGSAWTWSGVADVSSAVMVAGYAGDESTVFAITLSTGGTPTLQPPVPAVQLPRGEQVRSLSAFLGALVVVGTSLGVRMGAPSGTALTLAPLSIETAQPVTSIAEYGRFVYFGAAASIDGVSGLWRMDPGTSLADGRSPVASDMVAAGTGAVTGIVVSAGTVGFSTSGDGLRVQSSTPVASGWLQTSRLRFNTAEAKAFNSVRVTMPNTGAMVVEESPDGSSWNPLYTAGATDGTAFEVQLSGRVGAEVSLRFTLQSSAATKLGSYVLRATPAVPRRRLIQLPLMCYAEEKDRKGNRVARPAWERLAAVEELESSGRPVIYQDFITGETIDVTVESVKFVAVARPGEPNGWGGVLLVDVRTVRDASAA